MSRERPCDQSQFARRVAQAIAMEPERRAYVATAEDTHGAHQSGVVPTGRGGRKASGVTCWVC